MKILVKIKNNTLSFLSKKRLNENDKNMLNTSVISNDELVFSKDYILTNPKIIISFFNEIINTYKINTATMQNMEVAKIILPILKKSKNINNIYFESDEIMPFKICEELTLFPVLKTVNAYYIPNFMFELLDKNGIISQSRNEILFSSKFMQVNALNKYSSIFYKSNIKLFFPFSPEDYEDFTSFIKINKHLKTIHVNKPLKLDFENLINELTINKRKNIKIYIHGDVHSPELIEYLKNNNNKLKQKHKITLKLKYSDEYLENNLMKETNNYILKMCGYLILSLAVFASIFIFYDNYKSMLKVTAIQEEIKDYIIATNPEEIIEDIQKEEDGKIVVNDYLASLTSINPDVTGWLKVNNTNIDYAVLQSKDNSYYLDHNIYHEQDPNGWLFLDYENDPTNIDDNIIIYGHNRFINGVMFGTLNKALYKNWYLNSENQIIKYDTIYGSFEYQIFSIYIVDTTSDYLTTNFYNKENKLKFLDLIKNRSIHDFGIAIDANSKIITLSTCQSDTSRLVVHGVLIEK